MPRGSVHRDRTCGPLSESGPRSISSPSTADLEARASMEAPVFFEFPRPEYLASRGAALSHEPPSLSPLLSHALPHEHDLNAYELRSARRRPLAGIPVEPSPPRPPCGDVDARSRGRRTHLRERLRVEPVAGRSRLPVFPSTPAGVAGRKLGPEHPSSSLPNRAEAETSSEESVELPSRNLSRACARTSLSRLGAFRLAVRTASR